jgi:phosphoglycolate phosphatase-like HAD superfamily hydrolase
MPPPRISKSSVESVGVLTGGYSEQELTEAGATVVFDSVDHLREHLTTTSLQETVDLPSD